MIEAFNELGTRIAHEWSARRYDADALPEIAAVALERAALYQTGDYRSILSWITSTDTLPFQMNIEATFGEPPLTLFWHPAFYIEALFWSSSTTSVHGHGFAGAFQVLAGASLQSLFEFEAQQPGKGTCRLGHLRQTEAMLLRAGATQMILGGDRFIHSVFHLGYPSVTLVVRTHSSQTGRQYTYYRPGVAVAYKYEAAFGQLTNRLLQVARLQAVLKDADLAATVRRIGEQCELAASFKLLETIQPILRDQGRLGATADVISTLAAAIGHNTVTTLAQALTLERRLSRLVRAREAVTEDELRLFLALLLTQQPRRHVMSTVKDYTEIKDPCQTLARWIRELGARGILTVPTTDTAEQLIHAWLSEGEEAAVRALSASRSCRELEELVTQVKAEWLLTPLLQDGA